MDCNLKLFFFAFFLSQIYGYIVASTFPLDFPVALPSCIDRCERYDSRRVPYPFGIGKGCYKNKWFEVVCNRSSRLSLPYLPSIGLEVVSFSLTDDFIYGYRYYKSNGFQIQSPTRNLGCSYGIDYIRSLNLTGSPFFISDNNRFTVVGCNIKAMMVGTGPQTVGCEARCGNETQYYKDADKSCVGYKCCQNKIPPGLQVYDSTVEKLGPGKNSCQMAYLSREDFTRYELNSSDLTNHYTLNMDLEWRLEVPPKISPESSQCEISTSVIRTDDQYKYQCSCKNGYEGNPYLPGGCQDINECKTIYGVCGKHKCVNVPGSFRCEKTWPAILGGTLSSGLLLLVIGTWWLCKVNKKEKAERQKRKFFKRNGGLLLEQQTFSHQGSVNKTKLFSSNDLDKATDRFNASRILGQGGQGTVYKGMLEDGMIVAVKVSKALKEDNLEEFINEIILLSQINHRNVVGILGCCLETEVPMLVYEFIPNGSLFDHLQNPSEYFPMTWKVRLCIACEVADSLSYLHSAASVPIYHRDVKSTNILLDEKHRSKVSDFGISRSVAIDDTHLTTIVQGTVGYVDPEYLQSSHFTGKSDVYSFGVVLIELLTGGKPVSVLRPQEVRMLGAYFLEAMRNERLHEILDARIKEECDQVEVLAVAKLARRCLSLNSEHRPTMREVFIELDRMQSKGNGAQSLAENGEEHTHIQIAIPESMSLSYSSPCTVLPDSKPLMTHNTQ
ncbi:PREDICTED: wall-associated receptor kinase-like 8 [Brassica oleracea var. oleracea]|uniref:wall-associated receptor kinase-like 8 n=1 Tax=Brassica oleracea var. oleracea TaxID=109376 RepID=UPI0006A754B8|nr:PREDICTED: wall-associated receptor kinase-like 8 [Brassica oleracea var. oleracea]